MAVYKRGNVWWYKFRFAGRVIRESAKTNLKTLAKMAEAKRRRELEEGFNNLGGNGRAERVRTLREVAEDYLEEYLVRHESDRFVAYAIGHIARHLGNTLLVDISERKVKDYQSARLKEGTAAKTINEEVGILLRLLGDAGEPIRARMRRHKSLKLRVRQNVGKAYSDAEKQKLIAAARQSRSLLIYPALTLALHTTMRDSETRNLTWGQTDLHKRFLTVGKSKSEAGEGRTIPLNSVALAALIEHSQWYLDRFGEIRPEWYVFPFASLAALTPLGQSRRSRPPGRT